MAINITTTPAEVRSGYTSLFVAANNPVAFSFERTASEASLQVALYESDGTTQIVELRTVPFPATNTLTFDLSAFLTSELSNSNDSFDSEFAAYTDASNQYKVFRVGYRVAGTGSYTVNSTNYVAVNAVKQAGELYGQNLAAYLPDYTGGTVQFTGKFLQARQRQKLFIYENANAQIVFWPTMGVLLPAEVIANTTGIRVKQQNYIGTTLDSTVNTDVVYPSPISEGLAYVGLTSAASPTNLLDFSTIDLSVFDDSGSDQLIDTLEFVVTEVACNPIAIKWKNELGSWEVWVFEGEAAFGIDIDATDSTATPFTKIGSLASIAKSFRKTAVPSLFVSADNLTLDEAKALSGILVSPTVLYCTDDLSTATEALNWVTVGVADGGYDLYDLQLKRYKAEFTFTLLDRFTISN